MRDKKTKIIATISDLRCDVPFLKKLYERGMDVVRINTAHQTPDATLKVIHNIRKVSDAIPVMIDTKGPEIRTTNSVSGISLKKGAFVLVRTDKKTSNEKVIFVTYKGFVKEVEKGSTILIDDGEITLHVVSKTPKELRCKIVAGGSINKDKKSVVVPDGKLRLPSLTSKDKEYIAFAAKHDIEFIAHSFVRNKKDVLAIQNILDKHNSKVKIIAKIENQEGVDHIDEILEHVYGVMVARGDLGVELPVEQVPFIQKKLIRKCIIMSKPVITATQMLQSMMKSPRPTRAEVSDVANAIFDGTDAVMLSGETSYGDYPVEAVEMMARIAKQVESKKAAFIKAPLKNHNCVRHFLSKSAVYASLLLPTKAIIIPTSSGTSARIVASYRGKNTLYAKCFSKRVMRELMLSYSVHPSYMKQPKTTDELVTCSLTALVKEKKLKKDDLVIILAGTPGDEKGGANFLEINLVKRCLETYR